MTFISAIIFYEIATQVTIHFGLNMITSVSISFFFFFFLVNLCLYIQTVSIIIWWFD